MNVLWSRRFAANLIREYRDTTLSCREDRWRTARRSRRTSTSGSHSSRSTRRVICHVSLIFRSCIARVSIFLFLPIAQLLALLSSSSRWLRLFTPWSIHFPFFYFGQHQSCMSFIEFFCSPIPSLARSSFELFSSPLNPRNAKFRHSN